jgi:hypothetical protein
MEGQSSGVGADAVSPVAFRYIERGICTFDQLVGVLPFGVVESGQADADRDDLVVRKPFMEISDGGP